jgi:hypothetical protein
MTNAPALDLKYSTQAVGSHDTFEHWMLRATMAATLAKGEPGLPFYRRKQVAARIDPALLLERYSLREDWHITRPDPVTIVARAPDVFAIILATGSPAHCTMSFRLWAATPQRAEVVSANILREVATCRMADTLFRLDWRYVTSSGLHRANTMERPQEVLLNEAYPSIPIGVNTFIERFLEAQESVLVLQGPPGMGKTRLVREMLRQMSIRKNRKNEHWEDTDEDDHAVALYSGDKMVWETDEIFVEFLTGDHDALLVEDADHLISPRAKGNESLHRFLNASDGIARAQGRKIIFSTNLPNIRDLDDALVRPGRCFAHVHLRHLSREEAQKLLVCLSEGDEARLEACGRRLDALQKNHYSVADVYAAHRNEECRTGVPSRCPSVATETEAGVALMAAV